MPTPITLQAHTQVHAPQAQLKALAQQKVQMTGGWIPIDKSSPHSVASKIKDVTNLFRAQPSPASSATQNLGPDHAIQGSTKIFTRTNMSTRLTSLHTLNAAPPKFENTQINVIKLD